MIKKDRNVPHFVTIFLRQFNIYFVLQLENLHRNIADGPSTPTQFFFFNNQNIAAAPSENNNARKDVVQPRTGERPFVY